MNTNYQFQTPPGMLMKAIQNAQDSIAYHEHLFAMTSDQENMNIIRSILQDETDHLDLFVNLYTALFGERPDLHGGVNPQINSFIDGVKQSIMNKLYAYDFYKNFYLYDPNTDVKDTFQRVMLDENNHSVKLQYIYEKFLENRLV